MNRDTWDFGLAWRFDASSAPNFCPRDSGAIWQE